MTNVAPGTSVASATTSPDFQLHSLGWKAFQDLCLTVLSDQLGQAVQRYSPVRDGGRDGAFSGEWQPTPALRLSGETIVQCKFTNRTHSTLTASAFRDEFKKARNLVRRRPRNNYVLLTNYRVTAEFEEDTRSRFATFGCPNFHVFGYEWFVGAIQESPRLRSLVPRLYGLGDLSQIIDERWYDQTRRLLEGESDNLRKFVPTKSYRRAVSALGEHGFVLLLGEPAVGKTSIAATLALAAGDTWQCRPMKVERARQLRDHWNPHERKQLFWIDDAFGAMQYESFRAHEWNVTFPWLDVAIKSGAKVILTSRNYIYAHARPELKQTAFPLLEESQVVVDVSNLTLEEREKILYNHIRLGDQPRAWRRGFKAFFDIVASSSQFRPEIARRLGNRAFTKDVTLTARSIADFVARPEAFLRQTIQGLSDDDRAALAAIFVRGGTLPSPVQLSDSEMNIVSRLGGTLRGISAGLTALQGDFVRSATLDEQVWTFNHPTIGDAFASLMAENPEFVDLYISGASVSRLMDEVTCGRVEIGGVKVIVPTSRFDVMIRRLQEYLLSGDGDLRRRRWRTSDFLASRCSREFLVQYVNATPGFWDAVLDVGSYLSADSEFALTASLRQHRLLSDEHVRAIVDRVKWLAVRTPDADFLTVPRVRQFFTPDELSEVMEVVRDELVPGIGQMIDEWRSDYSSSDDSDEHFSALRDAFEAFRDYFPEGADARSAFAKGASRVESLISEFAPPERDDDHYDGDDARRSPIASETPARHIYDDIDA